MKNILIIGVNSTIGTQIFNLLNSKEGYNIYTTSRNEFDKNNSKHTILTPQTDTLNTDLLPDDIHELYYLPGSINLKPFGSLKPEDYLMDFNINVMGLINVLKATIKALKKGNGAVLAFSSVAASLGLQYHASVSTSKAALEGFIKAMASEYAEKVRFNALAISLSNTKMAEKLLNSEKKTELAENRNPLKQIGNPSKIAQFSTVINSETCDWLTGEIIQFDGGMKNLKVF